MRRLAVLTIIGLGWALSRPAVAASSDPVEIIRNFSDFQQVDLAQVLNGDILSERGSLMDFPNGISAQTCFFVPLPAEETAKRLQLFDPSPHAELKAFAFHALHVPCELADFQSLDFRTSQSSVRWLLDKTIATTPTKSELNLSRDEAQQIAECLQKRADAQQASECWAKLLLARASAFQQQGLAGIKPYQNEWGTVSPSDQLHAMLHEGLAVAHEFLPILKGIGLVGNDTAPALTPFYYWTLFDADYHGTIALGAVYLLPVDDHYQLADIEYYVNGSYYTSATLCEVWPIRARGKYGALVWRGDFFAAPMLRFTKGTERIAYGALMLQDIKKEIRCIQQEAKTKR